MEFCPQFKKSRGYKHAACQDVGLRAPPLRMINPLQEHGRLPFPLAF